jgi:hypothetical protein
MYGHPIIGFSMRFPHLHRVIDSRNNGFKRPIVAGEKLEIFMRNIETINMEREDKEGNMLYKQDSGGPMA